MQEKEWKDYNDNYGPEIDKLGRKKIRVAESKDRKVISFNVKKWENEI